MPSQVQERGKNQETCPTPQRDKTLVLFQAQERGKSLEIYLAPERDKNLGIFQVLESVKNLEVSQTLARDKIQADSQAPERDKSLETFLALARDKTPEDFQALARDRNLEHSLDLDVAKRYYSHVRKFLLNHHDKRSNVRLSQEVNRKVLEYLPLSLMPPPADSRIGLHHTVFSAVAPSFLTL